LNIVSFKSLKRFSIRFP